jgi:protein TonB
MGAMATRSSEVDEPRGLFCAVVAASVALHAGLVSIAPKARAVRTTALPSFIEIADLEARPPIAEPPVPNAPAAEPTQRHTRVAPATNAPRARSAAPATREAAALPASERPVDFTSTVLSSDDGPGVDVPPPSAPPLVGISTRAALGPGAQGPRFVPLANLARAPRAPRLDAALEKNYPAAARQSGIAGSAVLRVQVLADGRIGAVRRVSETFAGFADACERTVKGGVWEPPLDRDGKPVATEITYTCRFDVKT